MTKLRVAASRLRPTLRVGLAALAVGLVLAAASPGPTRSPSRSSSPAPTASPTPAVSSVRRPSITPTTAGPTAPPSTPATSIAPAGLAITMTGMRPEIAVPGDVLTVEATITNTSAADMNDVSAQLLYSPSPFRTRSDFDGFAASSALFGQAAPGGYRPTTPATLGPGQSGTVTLSVALDTLGLAAAAGSYPFGVEVQAAGPGGAPAAAVLHTYLPWWPVGSPGLPPASPLVLLWPLVDEPHHYVAQSVDLTQLSSELAVHQRLGALLNLGARYARIAATRGRAERSRGSRTSAAVLPVHPVPLTWTVDPLLIQEVHDLAAIAGRRTAGTARAWLHQLAGAVLSGDLLGLPYADPDIVALRRAGLAAEIARAAALGRSILLSDLGRRPLAGYAWPPGSVIDTPTLDLLAHAGGRVFVLSDALLPAQEQIYTASARSNLPTAAGTRLTLVTDSTLDAVLSGPASPGPASPATDPLLAVQRFLAETLFIDYEQPSRIRALVIAPDRRWQPAETYLNALLDGIAHAPWLRPRTATELLTDPTLDPAPRQPLDYSEDDRSAELPLSDLRRLRTTLTIFEAVLTLPAGKDPLVAQFEAALLRAADSLWRTRPLAGGSLRLQLADALTTEMQRVSVTGGQVTLTSHHGTVPITIVNGLPEPVRLRLEFRAGGRATITSPGGVQTIPAQTATQIEVGVTLRTAGVFPVQIQLLTRDGTRYGNPVQLLVNSTAYGALTLGITGGAFAVLIVAVIIRVVRRARRDSPAPPGG